MKCPFCDKVVCCKRHAKFGHDNYHVEKVD